MPQTSLTAWLSKPAGLQPPVPAKLHTERVAIDKSESGEQRPQTTAAGNLEGKARTIERPASPSVSVESKGSRRLPPNVELRACTKADIPPFKRLNSLLLPIPYQESFYREITEDPLTNNITLVAIWHDDPANVGKEKGRLVGAIRCRIFAHPTHNSSQTPLKDSGTMLYLSTLVLLSPYRSHGIATRMLEILTKRAIRDHGVKCVGAHVWDANADGLEWYRKRGFKEVGHEEGYYRRLKPSGAMVMQRNVSVMDLVEG